MTWIYLDGMDIYLDGLHRFGVLNYNMPEFLFSVIHNLDTSRIQDDPD